VFALKSQVMTSFNKFLNYYFILGFLSGILMILVTLCLILAALGPKSPTSVSHPNEKILPTEFGSIRFIQRGNSNESILFLHGFNNQLTVWNKTLSALGPCADAITIDIPGFGESTTNSNSFSLEDQTSRIITLLDSLKIKKVTLVGVSMGGSLSAWIAAKHPNRVKGVLLLAPSGFPDSLTFGGRLSHLYSPGLFNQLAQKLSASSIYKSLFPKSKVLQALSVTASYGDPWKNALEKIQSPTWILWSKGDAAVPFQYADKVAATIPQSILIPIAQEVGHDLPGLRADLIATMACKIH